MSARAYWSGILQVSLLTAPVVMVGAGDPHDVTFRRCHRHDDGSLHRISQREECTGCGLVVARGELLRARQIGPDRAPTFVPVTDDELDSLPLPTAKTIVLDGFRSAAAVPVAAWRREKTVYLGPGEGGAKVYRLLASAMLAQGVYGQGKVGIRGKEHLVIVEATEAADEAAPVLTLSQLLYADEVLAAAEIPQIDALRAARISDAELQMAGQLLAMLRTERSLDDYRDEAQAALAALIRAKQDGLPAPVVSGPGPTITTDMLAQLRASLERHRAAAAAGVAS